MPCLFHALLNLLYGHMFMEIVYRIDERANRACLAA
jgi:hypothetical protein